MPKWQRFASVEGSAEANGRVFASAEGVAMEQAHLLRKLHGEQDAEAIERRARFLEGSKRP